MKKNNQHIQNQNSNIAASKRELHTSVHGSPSTVHGSRFTVHGSRFTVHGSRFTVHGSRSTDHGSRSTVHGSLSTAHRPRLTVHVLFEDNHLIAINKRAGDIVQVDKTGDVSLEQTVKQYIKDKYNKPGEVFLGVAHRIDRPVSGAVLMARTSKALERLNEMFQLKEVKKTYWAIVKNRPPKDEDTLTNYLVRNSQKNKTFAYDKEVKDSKLAILSYKLIAQSDTFFLLEIDLQTGRHHQIRAQLGHIGCPIRGDLKYGFNRTLDDGSIGLHSRRIQLVHPVTKQAIDIVAPVPEDKLWKWFEEKAVS